MGISDPVRGKQTKALVLDGVSYHCFHQKVLYSGAVSLCRNNGMVLSMPKSRVALDKIARHCGFSDPNGNLHWVGAKKEPNGNFFRWNDGEVIDTGATIWYGGPLKQPSGDGPCVNNLWGTINDLPCEDKRYIQATVCQKPA